jgi:hypothetical protein
MLTTHGGRGQAAAGTPRGCSCGFRSQGASASSPFFQACEFPCGFLCSARRNGFSHLTDTAFPQKRPQDKALRLLWLESFPLLSPHYGGYGFIYI